MKKNVNSLVFNLTFCFGGVLPFAHLESGDRQVGIHQTYYSYQDMSFCHEFMPKSTSFVSFYILA